MYKFFFTGAFICFCIVTGCRNHASTAEDGSNTEDTTAVAFFPVTAFLKGQIAELDSIQVTPLRRITVNNKTDSVWLKKEDIKALLAPFFTDEINESNMVSLFKVNKFNDQSVNAVTFTYDPLKELPDTVHLRHWDIYINPQTGKITKLYIVKAAGDSILQLTWQTDKWAKITSLKESATGEKQLIKEDQVIWDLK